MSLYLHACKWHCHLFIPQLNNCKIFYFIFLQSKLSKLSQATKLEPLNEGGGSALLQMVSVYNDPSTRAVIIMIVQQYTINLT